MNFKDFIFCAIDFTDLEQSKKLISKIQKHIGGIKIGLEFFSENGPKGFLEIKKFGVPIFLDLKLKDIPNTVVIEMTGKFTTTSGGRDSYVAPDDKNKQPAKPLAERLSRGSLYRRRYHGRY